MKTLLSILLVLFLSVSIFSQDEEGEYDWRNKSVIKKHTLTKDVAYDVILITMVQKFVNSDAVIKFKDKESGKIVGKSTGVATGLWCSNLHFWDYTLTISIKDNKIKYEIISGLNSAGYELNWSIKSDVIECYDELIAMFQDELENYVDDGF